MSEVRSSDQWSQAQPLDQRKKILFLSLFFLLLEEEGRIEDSQWGHLSQKPLTVFCLFVLKKKNSKTKINIVVFKLKHICICRQGLCSPD